MSSFINDVGAIGFIQHKYHPVEGEILYHDLWNNEEIPDSFKKNMPVGLNKLYLYHGTSMIS